MIARKLKIYGLSVDGPGNIRPAHGEYFEVHETEQVISEWSDALAAAHKLAEDSRSREHAAIAKEAHFAAGVRMLTQTALLGEKFCREDENPVGDDAESLGYIDPASIDLVKLDAVVRRQNATRAEAKLALQHIKAAMGAENSAYVRACRSSRAIGGDPDPAQISNIVYDAMYMYRAYKRKARLYCWGCLIFSAVAWAEALYIFTH